MIIGNGLIAKKFQHNYKDVIIFVSGVSNSLETNDTQFNREKQLLKDILKKYPDKLLLYFSSRGLENKQLLNIPYYQHKLNMEYLIKSFHNKHIICRIHHIVGMGGNDSTIVNFLYNKILTQKSFDLWQNTYRYLIDVEDVYKIVDYIINNNLFINKVVNFPGAIIKVCDLVNMLENILKKSAVINIVDKRVCFSIDNSELDEILEKLGIYFHKDYIKNLLVKYYATK